VEVFSTLGIAGPQKVQSWNAILRGCADAIQVWPRDPSRFDGTLIRQRIGRVTVFEIRCSSVRLQHARNYPVRPRAASFQVLLPLQEAFSLTHGQSNGATVDEGSICLIDRSRPYEVVHGDHLRAIGVEMPSSLLEPLFPRASRQAGAVLRPSTGSARLLGALLRSLSAELRVSTDRPLPIVMARSIAGFVAAAFGEPDRAVRQRGARAQLEPYREYVESRLRDVDFRLSDVSREFRVSDRYVRLVFKCGNENLSEYVLRRRLELAAQFLRSPEHAQQTILTIAVECGFSSATHFSHSFRQRYGVTPSTFRRGEDGSL